jgi:WD40 repeat protein
MGPEDPNNDKTLSDSANSAADGDGLSPTIRIDPPGSERAHATAWSESEGQPTVKVPTACAVEQPATLPPPGDPSATVLHFSPGRDAPRPPQERPIPVINGYEVLGELGRGGMGVVYRARQVRLNRPCVLKMILAGVHADPVSVVRFLSEAEAVARLQHANIVQIHHIGEADGLPYFELEYVDGGSLDKQLDGTPWAPRRAAQLVASLACGIAEAHRLGIVHRDLKPGNVLVARDGTAKITDFGLAKSLHSESGLTRSDSIMGSPSYMAPEQAASDTKLVGPLTDIYALGAILYELLTGRPPFRGATILATLEQMQTMEPVPPRRLVPGLPRDIETIALKCLRKDPAKRYISAAALADDLQRFLAGEPVVARPVGAWERAVRWARRRPALAAVGAGFVAAVAGLLGLGAWSYHRIEEARDKAVADSYMAILGETRASRLAQRPNWRAVTRKNLMHLAALDTPRRDFSELRSEAVAGVGWLDVRLASRFPGHDYFVYDLDFSPDGQTLASAGFDGKICLWNLKAGTLARTLRDPNKETAGPWSEGAPMPAARFRPATGSTTSYLAYTTRGRSVQTVGWPSSAAFDTLTAGAQPRDLAFDRGGATLAVSWSDGNVRVHDGATGALRRVVDCGTRTSREFYRRIALAPAGNILATEGPDHTVQVHDITSDAPPRLIGRQRGTIRGFAFSPDGRILASASEDRSAKLWDVENGHELMTLQGHTSKVVCLAFSPDGHLIATAGDDGTLRLWDAQTGRPLMVLEPEVGNLQAIVFSPDGRRLAAACADIVVYDLIGGEERSIAVRGNWVNDLAYHPTLPILAVKTRDPEVEIWDLGASRERKPYVAAFETAMLAFSPDGRHLAITPRWRFNPTLEGPPLLLLDAKTGERRAEFPGAFFCNACFDASGTRLATGEVDGRIRVRDVASGRVVCEAKHSGTVSGLAFLGAGGQLVASELGGALVEVDANGGGAVPRAVFPGGIASLVGSPDRARIALIDLTGRVRFARFPRFQIDAELPRDQVSPAASGYDIVLTMSRDGRWLATAADHLVALWDAHTLRKRFNLPPHESLVAALAFASDSSTLAVGGGRELVSLVELAPIEAELASLGLDRSQPEDAKHADGRPRPAFRHVRWPAGFFVPGRLALLEHALELDPNQPELAMELSWLYVTNPDRSSAAQKALAPARRATVLAPHEPLCWSALALVEYRLGQWSTAADAARRSIQLDPEQAAPYDRLILAMCEHQLRRPEAAQKELQRANQQIADHDGPAQSLTADLRALRAEAEALLRGERAR